MNKAVGSVALLSLALGACQSGPAQPGPTDTQIGTTEQALCTEPGERNPLDNHLAALATAVLNCKNSLTFDDFFVDERSMLQRRFEQCRDQEQLRHIDELLAIQFFEPARAVPYFAGKWKAWTLKYSGLPCPTWELQRVLNPPTKANVAAFLEGTNKYGDEINNRWLIVGPDDCRGDLACQVNRAAECAGWAGDGFVARRLPTIGQIVTDPKWWKDNTIFNPDYLDPEYGYEHRMAQSGLPPGDLFGAINRAGERCTKYTADLAFIQTNRTLIGVDCDGFGWMCMTMCF